jgi:hypothetical protein
MQNLLFSAIEKKIIDYILKFAVIIHAMSFSSL